MSMGGGKQPKTKTQGPVAGLNVQTSVFGAAWPLVYGKARIPVNLLHYKNFKATAHNDPQQSGGKGGGSKPKASVSYTYSAAVAMAACVGSRADGGGITGIGKVWKDKEQHTLASAGLTLFSGAIAQSPWSFLTTYYPGEAVPYSGLAYVAASSLDMGSTASIPNYNLEVKALLPYNAGVIDDAEPSAIVTDYLTNPYHGAGLNGLLGDLTAFNAYCRARSLFISPIEENQRNAGAFLQEIADLCNSAIVWTNGQLNLIPYGDTEISGNGATYSPNLTPLYDLTYDDFMYATGTPPVRHYRKSPAEAYNHVRVEYSDRANDYNSVPVEAKDQASIDDVGLRSRAMIQAHAVTNAALARDVAQIQMQRDLFVRNTYEFTLPVRFSLLDLMDLVTLTDPALGLNKQLVRITDVSERDDELQFKAEEMNVGTAHAPVYSTTTPTGYNPDYNVAPGPVSVPLVMNAPGLLTATGYEMWIAAAGVGAMWGGCSVWISVDNVTYKHVGEMLAPSRYGNLHSSFPSGAAYDTTNVLDVDLFRGVLLAGTQADADNWRALCYVDGEWISYRDAVLVSGSRFQLDAIQRGGYGSTIAAHASGSDFARIDESVFKLPYDQGLVGQTVYFKFPSFNVYGSGAESLASATAYSHTVGASGDLAPLYIDDFAGNGVNVLWDEYSRYTKAQALSTTTMPPVAETPAALLDSVADAGAIGGFSLRGVTVGTNGTTDNLAYFGIASTDYNLQLTPGKYILSFFGRASVAAHNIRLSIKGASGTIRQGDNIALTTTRARYSTVIDLSAETAYGALLMVYMNISGVNGRTVNIDGLMIEPMQGTATAPSPYCPGASGRIAVTAFEAAALAQDTADGKIETYFQTTIPATPPASLGDLWFDTDDGNKLYRHNGTAFVVSQDTAISTAISNAAGAQATADGKIVTFFQSTSPTGSAVGDLWWHTTENILRRWNGSSWVIVNSSEPYPNTILNVSAYSGIEGWVAGGGGTLAQGADIELTFFTPSAASAVTRTWSPTNVFGGQMSWEPGPTTFSADVWVDAAVAGTIYLDFVCYASNGTTVLLDSGNAVAVKDGAWHRVTISQTAPAGTTFIFPRVVAQSATWTANQIRWRKVKLEKSTFMTPFSEDTNNRIASINAVNAIAAAATAQSTADGKIDSFYQTSPPTIGAGAGQAKVGDIWFDTDDSNKIYTVVSGSWVATPDSRIALALSDAATAQATADGKVTTFYSTTTPTATAVGDMWYNKLTMAFKRWNGSAWVDIMQNAGVAGANLIPNPTFAENTVLASGSSQAAGNPCADNWYITAAPGTGVGYVQRFSGYVRTLLGTPVVANGSNISIQIRTARPMPVEANAKYVLKADATQNFNGTIPGGVTVYSRNYIQWLDADGNHISYSITQWLRGAANPGSVEYTAPSNACACYVYCDSTAFNASGSSWTHNSTVALYTDWVQVSLIRKVNLDSHIDDGTNYGRLSNLDLYGSGGFNRLGLRFGASGHRLGSQRNMLQLTTQNVRSATALSATSAGAVTVNAHSVRYGSFSVSYSAVSNAVTGLTQGVTYLIYCVDDSYSGGSKTWLATTNPDALYQLGDGIYFAGQITIPTSGSSSGGGGGTGSNPGDWCVLADSFLPDGRLAGAAEVGTMLPCYNERPEAPNIRHLAIQKNETALAECVVLVTASGAWVGASTCTPMTLRDGRCVLITEMMNRQALVYRLDGSFVWEEVTGIYDIGEHLVAKLVVHQQCYPAGGTMGAFVFTHNIINQKP